METLEALVKEGVLGSLPGCLLREQQREGEKREPGRTTCCLCIQIRQRREAGCRSFFGGEERQPASYERPGGQARLASVPGTGCPPADGPCIGTMCQWHAQEWMAFEDGGGQVRDISRHSERAVRRRAGNGSGKQILRVNGQVGLYGDDAGMGGYAWCGEQ